MRRGELLVHASGGTVHRQIAQYDSLVAVGSKDVVVDGEKILIPAPGQQSVCLAIDTVQSSILLFKTGVLAEVSLTVHVAF